MTFRETDSLPLGVSDVWMLYMHSYNNAYLHFRYRTKRSKTNKLPISARISVFFNKYVCFLSFFVVYPSFLAAQAALHLPCNWLSHSWFAFQRDQRSNALRSGQITSNFLNCTQARWRLHEIRQPLTCFCTSSKFHTDETIETFQAVHLGRHLAFSWGQGGAGNASLM